MEKILTALKTKSYLSTINYNEETDKVYLDFELRNGYKIPLELSFDVLFPSSLPYVWIDSDKMNIPQKPHILQYGGICYLEKEGVVWSDDMLLAIDFVFERVEKVLFEKDDLVEFHREFGYYFRTLENREVTFSTFNPSNTVELIPVHTNKRKPFFFIKEECEQELILEKLLPGHNKNSNYHALYIPLNKTFYGRIPREKQPWTSQEIANMIMNCYDGDIDDILKHSENKKDFYYLIRVRLLTGQDALFCLWYKKKSKICKLMQPIIEEDAESDFEITPATVYRFDKSSLFSRGGGGLLEKKVLLIGAGAIGGDLAFLIARSGVSYIDLVDYDILKPENTYRHFLGFDHSSKFNNKTELLKEELEKRYPLLHVKTRNKNILDLQHNEDIHYEDYDLVISAIGNPNVERSISRRLLKTSTPAIFTWVEAYGIGGHVLMMNNGVKGCFDCMYKNGLTNEISFAMSEDKTFTKNFDGCSGTFTPYGSMDAMETALMASRFAVKVLRGEKVEHSLCSWKGEADSFIKEGHSLSDRYLSLGDVNIAYEDELFKEGCSYCKSEEK